MNYFKIFTSLFLGICIGIIATYTVINNNDKFEKDRTIQTTIDIPRENNEENNIHLAEKAKTENASLFKELNKNAFVIDIDGIKRNYPEQYPLIEYKKEIYLPSTFVASLFGEKMDLTECCLIIQGSPERDSIIISSSIIPFENLTMDLIKERLGEPIQVDESTNDHSGNKMMTLVYKEATFHFEMAEDQNILKSYTITSNFFSTHRGITVGSTKEELQDVYGEFYYTYNDTAWVTHEFIGISFKLNEGMVTEIHYGFTNGGE